MTNNNRTYEVEFPQTTYLTFTLEGPEGLTKEQVLSLVKPEDLTNNLTEVQSEKPYRTYTFTKPEDKEVKVWDKDMEDFTYLED